MGAAWWRGGGGAMPLRRSLKELAGGGCYTHGAPTELAASVGPGRARTDADGNVGAPVALHHKSRPLRGISFAPAPTRQHSHASSAGRRRSSLAPPRLLRSVSALELTDLGAERNGTPSCRTRPSGRRSRGAPPGSGSRSLTNRRPETHGTSPTQHHEDPSLHRRASHTNPNTTETHSRPCLLTHTR